MIDAPNVLTTSRLVLTPPVLADFEESAALWGDVEVMRYVGGAGLSRSMVWAGFLRQAGSWAMLGYGGWIVRERLTGRFVGEVAFGDKMREVTPAFADPEAGWVLATWAHGQGFATEAVAATHAWSDARFKGPRTVCMIDPRNEPSLRLAAKMGYAQFGRTAFRDSEVVLLQRPTPGAQTG
jgi:RimJ/RimL family protein N-acetyltransferase